MKLLRGMLCVAVLALGACGGTVPPSGTGGNGVEDGGGTMSGDAGLLPLFQACTDNSQCGSGLCTKASYDRFPGPICTYQCDANDMNPLCPNGCNPKGYCRAPM